MNTLNSNLILFSGRLLPPSETFILAQGEGLQQFTPYYVGSRRVKGLSLPLERTIVVNQGKFLGAAEEGLFKILGFAPRLYQKMQQVKPALIHAHFGVCGALALPVAKILKVPLVVTYHGLDATMCDDYARRNSLSTRIYLQRREALKHEARLFIAVSNFVKDKLIEQGFPPEKIVVHYIGVDTTLFQPVPAVQRQPVVLFVGRLVEKKGCEYLIHAMNQVQAVNPEVELVVIGDGVLRSQMEQLAQQKLRRYRFLGMQPPETVRAWMNQSQVFCVPSITATTGDSEAFGLVFAEAQAMGLPIVSFASGGIPEAVLHDQTGFLVPERDSQGLATYILRLLQEPLLWQRFSVNGQQRVRTHFDLRKQTQALESIYQAVLSEKF